ncbi:hypothetical protein C8T65DRAFT_226575 [Cerioporus squamosus]|nr:hypothetical protein C8T65DRAFT_226575 [Cerioporus squamosus]
MRSHSSRMCSPGLSSLDSLERVVRTSTCPELFYGRLRTSAEPTESSRSSPMEPDAGDCRRPSLTQAHRRQDVCIRSSRSACQRCEDLAAVALEMSAEPTNPPAHLSWNRTAPRAGDSRSASYDRRESASGTSCTGSVQTMDRSPGFVLVSRSVNPTPACVERHSGGIAVALRPRASLRRVRSRTAMEPCEAGEFPRSAIGSAQTRPGASVAAAPRVCRVPCPSRIPSSWAGR